MKRSDLSRKTAARKVVVLRAVDCSVRRRLRLRLGILFCCLCREAHQPTQFVSRRPLVDVIPRCRRITALRSAPGTVEPVRRVNRGAGQRQVEAVSELFLDACFFEVGDMLLELEKADYEFAIARAVAQEAAAVQRVAEERGRNLQAQREWRDLGTSEANDLFLRKPQLRAAEASLAAAKADVAAAELALKRTTVRAPFDGRLESKSDIKALYAGHQRRFIH